MEIPKISFLFLLALALVFGGYNMSRALLGPKQGEDFAQYYVAGRLIAQGKADQIYNTGEAYQESAASFGVRGVRLGGDLREVMTYAYPPFAAVALFPLTLLPYDAARLLFFVLSLAATLLAIPILFANREGRRKRELILVGLAAVVVFFPNHYSLYMGQINSLLLLSSLLSLYFLRKDRPLLSGFFLALAATVKIFPLILLLAFLAGRKYKALLATLVFTLLLGGLTALICGGEPWRIFFQEVLPEQYSGGSWVRNQGYHGFFSRLLTTNEFVGSLGDHPWAARILSTLFALATVAAAAFTAVRQPSTPFPHRLDLISALLLVTTLLALAKSWEHYGIFLLPSYLLLYEWIRFESDDGNSSLLLTTALLLSFCTWTFILTTGTEYAALPGHPVVNIIISAKFFATLVLFACNMAVLRQMGDKQGHNVIH